MSEPLAYLITWRTYGTWLPGEDGAVELRSNTYGTPTRTPSSRFVDYGAAYLKQPPNRLTPRMRQVVDSTIRETAVYRSWTLHSVNVRTNHVHVVITAPVPPEQVMNGLKSWCTRRLREAGELGPERMIWTRHGSTRYLWKDDSVNRARHYVEELQDEPLTADERR